MKKNTFILLKKTNVVLTLFISIILLTICFFPTIVQSVSPNTKYTVVIDAGHGGIDGGCEGRTTGISEASLNLDYALCLKQKLTDFGFNVIMTRTTESGLYSPLAKNKKKDDMKKRRQIIESSNADFVISIHMNAYTSTAEGAQVYYGKEDEPSKSLATNIQNHFIKNLPNARKEIKVGDYYMLNAINAPSVLVECGFLSNPKEEALLLTEKYKDEICYCMLLGVLEYLR